ncbi:MAG: D-glycero-beta-D-manno-heptose-7-phosphate kinase [Alphaproteobacteria bacterium]|nr:D-glycero-beta-D-manno-heptose-7-phosphate kinase [Alphaproteobacteria bacterium]
MSDLASRLDQFTGRRVLCVGDLMLDRYVYGQVERISPEAPIPVLHTQRETATLGGAGNVVRNIAALGGKVEVIGVVGDDQTGRDIADAFNALPSVTAHMLRDASRPSTQKTRYVADGQQLLRADYEKAQSVAPDIEQQIIARVADAVKNIDAVILSDYAKGVLTPNVIAATVRLARQSGKIVIVDPKGRDIERYRGASYLTPNRKELSEAVGKPILTVDDADAAARDLIRDFDIENVLVKLGADGVCLVRKDQPALHLHTKAREVFDVSGAGDSVAATLALALASGFGAAEAAELANIAGSIVVGKVGTASVAREEIARELLQGDLLLREDKVVNLAAIGDVAERWRKQGLKVGFTNGCFDLLHPGHISLLRQAKAACDKLVVGLNSDASVKRLKGETRPVQNEASRSAVLASLADVDQVVIFGEDTPFELIKVVRPDVLVKGADYTVDKVVGADLVQNWGGKVVLAQLVEGQSTTGTIARMAG